MDKEKCIRCGKCLDVYPQDAIRHDSEKTPLEIKENLEDVEKLMKNFEIEEKKKAFLGRIIKHYNKDKKVAEETAKKIKARLSVEE